MAVGFTGSSNFRWFGDRAKTLIGDILDTQMRRAGQQMVQVAQSLVPVKTGKLHDSIGYSYDKATRTLRLYADTSYALYAEFGTYKTRAQPFLRPALLRAGSVWGRVGQVDLEFAGARTDRGMGPKASTGLASRNARVNSKLHRGAVRKARIIKGQGRDARG